MKRNKPRIQKRAGHMETRLLCLSTLPMAAVLLPVFNRARDVARHNIARHMPRPPLWHSLLNVGALLAAAFIVWMAFFFLLLWMFGFYVPRKERAGARNRPPLGGFSASEGEGAEQKPPSAKK